MFESGLFPVGVLLFFIGLVFLLVTYIVLRAVPKIHPMTQADKQNTILPDLPTHSDAVLMVRSGGRVSYLNDEARTWFSLWDDDPNLERIARSTCPADTFLGLCASEGQARFSVNGQWVEGTSYAYPGNNKNTVLISMRPQQVVAQNNEETEFSNQTLEILTNLSQSMATDLHLETTLLTILSSVEQLIPTDFAEITIWDSDNQWLVPYRLMGVQGLDQHLEKTGDRYPLGEGYSGYIAKTLDPLLIDNVDEQHEIKPIIDRVKYPFQSYLGIPLVMGGELVGTLDLTSHTANAYTENDLELLRLLSGQAAIALHNALLYQDEQRRANELTNLANLTQAINSTRDSQDLFKHLVDGISPLLDIEIIGFLIYNENTQKLEARQPFVGVPPNFVDLYSVSIPQDSPAERIWEKQEIITASNATTDQRLIDLGIDHAARAAGIRNTLLIPLKSGGRSLGYLQAANKKGDSHFDQDDHRILSIVAGQAAPMIENADLMQQSVHRALRAESMRRIASLSGSVASLDEILKYSVLELARLFQVDYAAVFLLDENISELRVHEESLYGADPELIIKLGRIHANDPEFRNSVTQEKQPYLITNTDEDPDIAPLYRTLYRALQIKSAVDVPIIIRERGLGEIILASKQAEFFIQSDIQLAITVASQLSVAIERSYLASQTDVDLRKRVEQLTALTRISQELNTSVDLHHLLQRVYEEAIQTTKADCGTIMLFILTEDQVDTQQIVAFFGEEPGSSRHPLENIVLENGEPVVVANFDEPSTNNITDAWSPPHKGIKASLVIPIGYQEKIAGLIHLHGKTAGIFDNAAIDIVQALAVQAAIAIGNAQRYQNQLYQTELLNRRVDTLSNIFEVSRNLHLDQPLEKTLEDIAYGIQSSTTFDVVLVSVFNPNDKLLHRISNAGLPLETMQELQSRPQPWENIQRLMNEDFRFGRSYFIPYNQRPDMPESWHTVTIVDEELTNGTKGKWHPQDILIVPLTKPDGKPLGLISIDAPRNNLRPDNYTIETLEIFSSQAALAIESQQRVIDLQSQVNNLADKFDRTDNIQQEYPELVEQNINQEATIGRLDQFVHRVTAGLGIIETINRQADLPGVLSSLGAELRDRLGLDIALIAETGPNGSHILQVDGQIPEGVNPEALFGQRNPLHQSLQFREVILISNIEESQDWQQSPLLNALETQALICLPITSQSGWQAAVLGISHQKIAPFTEDDVQLFDLISRQMGTAVNNLNLLIETGQRLREVNILLEFSQRLGGIETNRILETLLESAFEVVQSADTGVVTLLDAESNLLLPHATKGYANDETIRQVVFSPDKAITGKVFKEGKSLRLDEVNFAQDFNLVLDNLLNYRDATGGKLPLSSMLVAIQSGDHQFGVMILDNFNNSAAFSAEDQALIESLTRQTALTLENVQLFQSAEKRATQLQALSNVAAKITSRLEPELLIDSLLDSLAPVVSFDTGTLWLRTGDSLTIQSTRGFSNSNDLVGISTSVEDSRLFYEMMQTSQPIAVNDVRTDDRFPGTEEEHLSWIGVPMLAKGELIGVVALEKMEAGFYTSENIQAATTFASQAAVALENATLYQQSLQRSEELDKRTQRLALLNRFSNRISSTLETKTLIQITLDELQQAVQGTTISVVMSESESLILRAELPKIIEILPLTLPNAPVFDYLKESFGIFSTRDVQREESLVPLQDFLEERSTKALLILPLAISETYFGFVLVHSQVPRRFTPDEIDLGRILTNQAAVAIQNASLFVETRRLTEELEKRVAERTEQLGHEHLRAQTLLQIMEELSASLDLDHVLNRTLARLNETTGAQQSTILLVRPDDKTFYYRAALGYTNPPPSGGRPSTIPLDGGLAGWVINRREGAMIEDLLSDPRWVQQPDGEAEHRSAIAVPLMVGAETLGSMLLFHRQPGIFTSEQRELVQAAANQIAVAINNNELFNLIREQAESLGGMLRTQQVEASRLMSILEAVADGVLVTDSQNNITLFNQSAQHILDLGRDSVVGNSLATFTGLFGGAARSWMETIHEWANDPTAFSTGDTYSERITLDNQRVVSIHLAPVVMRQEFLGTVSVFRDITHHVAVDRLKSEFVATVSHELRTPMTSIKGYVDVLLMGAAGALNDQQTSYLQIVKTNTERLNILVNDLLDVSRIEAGKVTLSIQPLDIGEIAGEVIEEQLRQSEEDGKPMKIDLEMELNFPRVPGDPERVHQILGNLINNAFNYTPPEGQIKVYAHIEGDEAQIDIKDNGIGIKPEDAKRIFERFFRGEDPLVLESSGNGLGLAITQQLIEMHHGRIWMKSNGVPGDGSVFSFTLPLQPRGEDTYN
jgi:PAS domain S-box-containing protein